MKLIDEKTIYDDQVATEERDESLKPEIERQVTKEVLKLEDSEKELEETGGETVEKEERMAAENEEAIEELKREEDVKEEHPEVTLDSARRIESQNKLQNDDEITANNIEEQIVIPFSERYPNLKSDSFFLFK